MRKILIAGAFAAAAVAVAAAEDTATINLNGVVAKTCDIAAGTRTTRNVDVVMSSTAAQSAGGLAVSCNYNGNANVTFTSAKGGVMNVTLGDRSTNVGYNWIVDGAPGVQLTSPLTTSLTQTTVHTLEVQLLAAATRAGTYTDVVTAVVQPN